MSEKKRPKTQSKLRKTLKCAVWTAGVLMLLFALLCVSALLTIDMWIVPLLAWCTDTEVEGTPSVRVSVLDREIVLGGLTVNVPTGRIRVKTYGLRLDGVKLDGLELKELRVSHVYAEELRAELDFARYADSRETTDDESISGEKFRVFSHKVWNRASKPVVRAADLTLKDAEIRWKSGAAQSVVSIPDLNAVFEGGILTKPQLTCDAGYRLNDPQRSIQFGAHIKASASRGGEGIIVSAAGNGPLVIDLPDSHLEIPPSETTDMVVQYEPESDVIRFGGEWGNPDRWTYAPLDMSLDNALLEVFGTLALDGEKLRLRFGTSAQGSDIVCRNSSIPGDVMFEAKCNVDFDLANGGVTLDSLSARLTGPGGGRIDLDTSGVFEFVRHEDATYTLEPRAARLSLVTAKPLDLTPFDPVLPFDSAAKSLTGDYFIELDPDTVCLNGGAGLVVRDRETGARVFDADATFETDGVNRISSFHVSRCSLSFYDGDDRICDAGLTGEYNIRTASLKGDVNYYPYRMIETFGSHGLADLCVFLDDANLRDAEHAAVAELDLDLVNMAAKLHKESHLSHLALTGSNGTKLDLEAIGDADFRLMPDDRGWRLECGLELRAGTDFQAALNASGGSDTVIAGRMEISRLSDVLARQLERKFFPGREDLPVLRFLGASASSEFRFDPAESRIVLSGAGMEIDNGDGRLVLHCDSELSWTNGEFCRAPLDLNLKTQSLPVSFWETFLGDGNGFGLAGGVLTSELDLSVGADGKVISGEGKLVGTDLTLLFYGKPREIARLGANGSFVLNREKPFLILPDLNLDLQDRRARTVLFASGSGTADLADGCRTRMHFPEVRFGPEFLYLIGFGIQRSFYFDDLDAAGEIDFSADRSFSEMSWTGGMKINRLRLQSDEPDEYRFPDLSGGMEGGLQWTDGELFGDVTIRLADDEGEEHISGRYLYRHGEDFLPKFISSSLDLPFAVSYFRYNHNTDPGVEPTALSLFDKTIALDLHGIYARNHSLIFSASGPLTFRDGGDPAILAPHMEFSGDVSGTASAEIRVKDGAWPFEAEADLNDIPFDKCFAAFLATDDNPEIPHGLHGFIKRLKAVVQGEGFTTEALARNFQTDCKAELEGVSLRSSLRDRSTFLNILLLPLVSVPRLIDYVPGEMVRRALRLATAGSIMDMISGEAPIEFRRGTMELSVRRGVLELRELLLEGDQLETYSASGTVDLAGEGMADLETNARFALFFWPFYLNGDILDPKVSYGKSISHFFTDNAKYLLTLFPNMIMSAFSEEDADEIDRLESEKEKEEKEKRK